ncbi:MAG: DUF3489 domain-containing protein [Sphingomonadales bacterium]
MSKLTDTQLVILSAAAAREDHTVLPPPTSLTLNKAALTTVLKSLIKRGLIAEQPAATGMAIWREDGDHRNTLVIAAAGLEAIGVETNESASKSPVRESDEGNVKGRRSSGKTDDVLALLRRTEGASIADMNGVTNWQAHSIRAFLSGLRKRGVEVTRSKDDGGKAIYRIDEAS